MSSSSDVHAAATAPSHDQISRCARELWIESEQPEGCDEMFWLEAESRLRSAQCESEVNACTLKALGRPEL
ncbi:MAG: DUF2934 domain-containing protein [Opitutaceae bacterium]